MDNDAVEIFCSIVRDEEDEKAILINDGIQDVWIPRSVIESKEHDHHEYYKIGVPEWFAVDKGLV